MAQTKLYQQLLRQRIGQRKKQAAKKPVTNSELVLLSQPLFLINYVSPASEWLKIKGKVKSPWRRDLDMLKKSIGNEKFKTMVNKIVKNKESRQAVFNYVR